MKKLVLAGAMLAALGGAASAADMAVKARPAPPPIPAWSWSGFYLGINGGYSVGTTDFTQIQTFPGSPGFVNLSGVPTQMNAKGGFFGGQVGFNWQIGPIVWGAEADYQGASQSGTTCGFVGCIVTVTTPPFPAGTTTANSTVYQKVKWFSTARARVGYANEGAMIYVTGGGAWMGIDETDSFSLSSSFPPPASAATAASFSNSKSGYSVGAGLEMRLWADLTAKVEYLHLDVSGTTNSALHVAGIAFGALVQTTTTGRIKDDIVRVGLNWKFSGFGFGGPVYAAY